MSEPLSAALKAAQVASSSVKTSSESMVLLRLTDTLTGVSASINAASKPVPVPNARLTRW